MGGVRTGSKERSRCDGESYFKGGTAEDGKRGIANAAEENQAEEADQVNDAIG